MNRIKMHSIRFYIVLIFRMFMLKYCHTAHIYMDGIIGLR